jgi:hypothetical protein
MERTSETLPTARFLSIKSLIVGKLEIAHGLDSPMKIRPGLLEWNA